MITPQLYRHHLLRFLLSVFCFSERNGGGDLSVTSRAASFDMFYKKMTAQC